MLRTAQSLPQEWAFDTGLRPRPFPLAATRTGLTPASDDEPTTQDQPPTRSTSCPLGARKCSLRKARPWSAQGERRPCGSEQRRITASSAAARSDIRGALAEPAVA